MPHSRYALVFYLKSFVRTTWQYSTVAVSPHLFVISGYWIWLTWFLVPELRILEAYGSRNWLTWLHVSASWVLESCIFFFLPVNLSGSSPRIFRPFPVKSYFPSASRKLRLVTLTCSMKRRKQFGQGSNQIIFLLVYEAVKTTLNDKVWWWVIWVWVFYVGQCVLREWVVRGGRLDGFIGVQGLLMGNQV